MSVELREISRSKAICNARAAITAAEHVLMLAVQDGLVVGIPADELVYDVQDHIRDVVRLVRMCDEMRAEAQT